MTEARKFTTGARGPSRRREAAFSLTELMVASSIFAFCFGGVIVGHLFGLKLSLISQTLMGGSDTNRRAVAWLMADIRAAKTLRVGQGNASTFTEVSAYSLQQGNAIQIYTNNSTSSYIRYYVDTADNGLKRLASGTTSPLIVASYLSSTNVFTCEDYSGTVMSNRQSGFILGVSLPFSQVGNPGVAVGTNASNYYTSFNVQIKIASRSPD